MRGFIVVFLMVLNIDVSAQIETGNYTMSEKCLGFEKTYSFGDKGIMIMIENNGNYTSKFFGYKSKEWMLKGKWEVNKKRKTVIFIPNKGRKRRFKIKSEKVLSRRVYILKKIIWRYQDYLNER